MTLNLATWVRDNARRHPARPAVFCGDAMLDHRELYRRCRATAGALRALGIGRGDHVALLLPNVPDFTICYFACHHIGAVVVPLNVLLVADEIEYHLDDCDAVALIAWHGFAEAARDGFERVAGCRHLLLAGCDEAAAPATALAPLVETATPDDEPTPTAADDVAVILYTSGTTGHPKGAELTQFNLFYNAEYVASHLTPVDHTGVALVALPLFHSFGQTALQNAHLSVGGAIVLQPRFEPGPALALMRRHAVSAFAGVPTMFFALLHHEEDEPPPRLRYCVSGGAPMPVEVMHAFDQKFGVNILEGYGLSETSPVASFNVLSLPRKPGTVGQPIRGVEFRLIDESGATVSAIDTPGEICIKGHNVMRGYYRRPEETEAALRDGWFRTGDVGTVDADGYYRIVDRIKDMVLRGGFNVYPREIEEVLYAHPAIAEAAVIGIPDERHGEEVVAMLALKPGQQATADEIIAYCKQHLAAYKYPRIVRFFDALPKGPTGKILKRALRAQATESE